MPHVELAPPVTDGRYPVPQEPAYALVRPEVVHVEVLTPRVRRVTLAVPDLHRLPRATQDQWVKLFFPLAGQQDPVLPEGEGWYPRYLALPDPVRPPMRTYTVRDRDDDAGTLAIDFVLHGDLGPASRWASSATPGDRLALFGPGHAYLPPADADVIWCFGDETALPAVSAVVESADARPTLAVVEVEGAEEFQPLASAASVELTYLARRGVAGPAPRGTRLLEAVRALETPAGRLYAWVAGEASVVRAVRAHLVRERGLDRRQVTFVGYWREGRTEDQAGEDQPGED